MSRSLEAVCICGSEVSCLSPTAVVICWVDSNAVDVIVSVGVNGGWLVVTAAVVAGFLSLSWALCVHEIELQATIQQSSDMPTNLAVVRRRGVRKLIKEGLLRAGPGIGVAAGEKGFGRCVSRTRQLKGGALVVDRDDA
jgi:hypothetical protein